MARGGVYATLMAEQAREQQAGASAQQAKELRLGVFPNITHAAGLAAVGLASLGLTFAASDGDSPDTTVPNAIGSQFDLSAWQALAADSNALLDRIDRVMFHGAMPATTRNTILAAVDTIPASDPATRSRAALYLALSSMQYQVEQ